ncbi:MAG: RpiB/LacA/LacB family sugar-phosphate isomerase [Clostridia bacterium]|nr:RpiB/LacA/LacB family sugar-phosphate isomerase [Clostridia bacterium]
MKIALINENSQASKNRMIYEALNKVALKKGHVVHNYGIENAEDVTLTYVQAGLLAAILLNSGAADFVVTGCGTGEGAMLALNSFPNVLCGHIVDPTDAYLFAQINNGNAIAIPFAKGFGWGSELTLESMFEELFKEEFGKGYPKERAIPEQRNKMILDEVKKITHTDIEEILEKIDQDFLMQTIQRETFQKYFFENATDESLKKIIRDKLEK